MSANNPTITASDIIEDIENRLGDTSLSSEMYLPWVSYAYQKTYQALISAGQQVKENLFGNLATLTLTPGVGEYSISENIPRFGGFIKVEIKYGATNDEWIRCHKLASVAHWRIQNNNTVTFRGKTEPLYYQLEDVLGFIPVPVTGEVAQTPQARVYYVRRPYQITLVTDTIDIDYRFLYPITNYVTARAMEAENEDYSTSEAIERRFERDLERIVEAAISEFDENEPNAVLVQTDNGVFDDPFRW